MKQRHIGFRDLLERLLPIEELPPVDRLRVQRALRSGVAQEVEHAALHAMDLLEQQGALRRLPVDGREPVVRYQARNRLDVITLALPAPRLRDGVVAMPRNTLPTQAPARLDQVRRLIRLDDPLVFTDPRTDTTRAGLLAQLEQAGPELLGTGQVRYFGREDDDVVNPERPFDAALATEAMEHPQVLLHCADTEVEHVARGARANAACARSWWWRSPARRPAARPPRGDVGRGRSVSAGGPRHDRAARRLRRRAGRRANYIEKLVFVDRADGRYNRSYYDLQIREIERALREGEIARAGDRRHRRLQVVQHVVRLRGRQRVLVQVAHALRKAVRPFDPVARAGTAS